MRSATLSGFGQGAGPVSSVRFEPPEFDPPQAVASRVSASTMNEEQRRILASLGVRDTLRVTLPRRAARLPAPSCSTSLCSPDFERVNRIGVGG